jgi:hypothetical protein
MNWKRGALRLWVLVTVLWVGAVGWSASETIAGAISNHCWTPQAEVAGVAAKPLPKPDQAVCDKVNAQKRFSDQDLNIQARCEGRPDPFPAADPDVIKDWVPYDPSADKGAALAHECEYFAYYPKDWVPSLGMRAASLPGALLLIWIVGAWVRRGFAA